MGVSETLLSRPSYDSPSPSGRSPGLEWIRGCRLGKTDAPVPPSTPKLDGPSIIAAAEAELRRLGTDYLDLFQLHWPDR